MVFRRNNSETVRQKVADRHHESKVDELTADEKTAVIAYIQENRLDVNNEQHKQLIINYIEFLRSPDGDGGGHAEYSGGRGKRQVVRAGSGYSNTDGGDYLRPSREVTYGGGLEIPPKLMSLISGAQSRELQMSLINAYLMIISGQYPQSKLAFDHACTNRLFKTAYRVLCDVAEAEERYKEAVDWFSEVQDRFDDGEDEILVYSSRADGWLPAILLRINEDGTFVYQLVDDKGNVKGTELLGKNILNLAFEADEDDYDD